MTSPQALRPRRGGVGRGTVVTTPVVDSSVSGAFREIFSGVQWTPSLIAFLYYYFVVITYWLPFADIAMVIAIVSLLFQLDQLRIGRVLILFGAFVAWAWLAFVTSPYQAVAFDQTWTLTKLWMVTFVAYNVLRTREQLRFFFVFATGCFVLFPLRGAFINYFGGYSVFGRALWNFAYANPNDLAGFAIIFASTALALMVIARNRLLRLAALCSAVLMLLLIFFTQSRGALLAVGAVVAILVVTRLRNIRVVLAAVGVVGAAAFFAPKNVWDRLGGLANISLEGQMKGVDQEGSAEQRYQLMRVAARIAADNPLTGVGAGAYHLVHGDYARAMSGEFPMAGGNKDAHNTYLRTAAELGFIGLALFLLQSLGSVVRGLTTSRRMGKIGADGLRFLVYGLIAFLLAGLFASLAYINVLHLHFIIIECCIVAFGASPVASARRARSPAQSALHR